MVVVNENGGERKEQASQAERAGARGSGASSLPSPLIFSSLARRSPCGPPTEGLEKARRVVSLRSTLWLVQLSNKLSIETGQVLLHCAL